MSSEIISLPLGNTDLVITLVERGYKFSLRQRGYDDTPVFSVLTQETKFCGITLHSQEIQIIRDFNDPSCMVKLDLLDPALRPTVSPKDGGPYSLYCAQCHCWVPNTANSEMRKEGMYSHHHVCGIRSSDEVYMD